MRTESRDFGAELRRLRVAAGFSLRDLSGRIHYSRSHLSKVENNHAAPSLELARLADAALRAQGQLINLLEKHSAREKALGGSPDDIWTVVMDLDSGTWFSPSGPGQPALHGAAAVGAFRAASVGDVSAGQGELILRAFRASFEEARALGRLTDSRIVLPALWSAVHTLRQVAVAARPPVRQSALLLASRYAELAGWMAQEAGDDRAALWWTELSVQMAEAGGDEALSAYSQVRRALIALYRGDAAGTVDPARQAQARSGLPMVVRGMASLREAQGLALAGDETGCRRAIDRGAEFLARRQNDDPALPKLGSTSLADPVAVTAGWCLYDLGQPARAADMLAREIGRIPAGSKRAGTRFAARHALATAAMGELDVACELTRSLLTDAHDLGSATIKHDLRQLARTFRRWPTHKGGKEIQSDLDQLLRPPAPVSLVRG